MAGNLLAVLPMLRLSTTHDRQIRQADFPTEATDLGAAADCGIHLPFPGVSRRHARVEPVTGGIRLIDLGSKNGLRQKGRRLLEVTLHAGESVHLGRARLTVEQIDTSDAILAAPRRKSRANLVGASEKDHTDTVATDGLDSTPGEALRLLRDVETSGVDLTTARGNELLDRAVRILGATSLFSFTPSDHGPALRQIKGRTPTDKQVVAAFDLARDADDDEILSSGRSGGETLMVGRLGPHAESPVLGVLLSATQSPIKPWRRDLFGYIAHRLRPAPSRKPATPRSENGSPLSLPAGFVRGRAATTTRLLEQLQAAVRSDLDVLILGETGTGKEYVARIIHDSGPTARGPFVAINCAAIPSELLEAELFGVKARVATGVDARTGLLTRAQGGCVFLDEIGDMPQALQAKLLRALQEREVMPIGGHSPEPIHVRVLSSTNKDLTSLVRGNHFRPDLYYRLRGLEFIIPPLRDRAEDIAILALAFADRAAESHGKQIAGVSRRALNLLEAHDWPGNVRELRSEIERAVLLCPDGGTLSSVYFESLRRGEKTDPAGTPESEGASMAAPSGGQTTPNKLGQHSTLASRVDDVETHAIMEALAATHGNRTAAARRLGITRNGLALKMKRLKITKGE